MNRWTRLPLVTITALAIGVAGLSSASGAPPAGDGGADRNSAEQAAAEKQQQQQKINAPNVITSTEFVPVTPCRIYDTRIAGPGKLTSGGARNVYVAGTFGFAPQGGKSGGCGVPTGASAVSVSLTAVGPEGIGYLRAWAAGTAEPTATVLNYNSSQQAISVTSTIPIRTTAGTGMTVKAFASRTHLVADVLGYYREPIAAWINTSGTTAYKSTQVISSTRTGVGQYSVNFERNVSGCVIVSNATASFYNVGSYTSGSSAYFFVRDVTVANSPYADSAFTFTVTC